MRKMVFAFAVLAAFGLTLSLASTAKAEEGTVTIKTGMIKTSERNHDHDRRWHHDRHHRKVVTINTSDRGRWHRDRDHGKVVIIKQHRHRDYDND